MKTQRVSGLREETRVLIGPNTPTTSLSDACITSAAPAGFKVIAQLCNDSDGPWLWIGVDGAQTRAFFAKIGGKVLRQLAVDVLRRYPEVKSLASHMPAGGAR